MRDGGSIVAMSFSSDRAFPIYNWMGVHKAALEALVKALARRHGRDRIRVNCVSAGPLLTTAAGKIPGFDQLCKIWEESSPIKWDPISDKRAVAEAVAFLLGPHSARITGQTIYVDGGASAMGGPLQEFEKKRNHGLH
jgi:enoyl-[acyl-carrier protein] reductase I